MKVLIFAHERKGFAMIVRNCAGGIVFNNDNKVLLLKNEKGEWVFPKGVIRNSDLSQEVAVKRVKEEAGVTAEIVSTIGHTNYEFFYVTRQKPVCNKVVWFIMKSSDDKVNISEKEKFNDGGFYSMEDALNMVTYSQDKAILNLSYRAYSEMSQGV